MNMNLSHLPLDHQVKLRWFEINRDTVVDFPAKLPEGVLVTIANKAIYKPANLDYAVSVRSTISSDYEDGEVQRNVDGSWQLRYAKERPIPSGKESYTTFGLEKCLADGVPVGVLKQVESIGPKRSWAVLGLAIPEAYDDGYFTLRGLQQRVTWSSLVANAYTEASVEEFPDEKQYLDFLEEIDLRRIELRNQTIREGQAKFRRNLMSVYGNRCLVTGVTVPNVLDAAHIQSYNGPASNDVSNGVILRADIHKLFDAELIAINPQDFTVHFSASINSTAYAKYDSVEVYAPETLRRTVNIDALKLRWETFAAS